jgi:iron only hydrogenase large subunit-like protein
VDLPALDAAELRSAVAVALALHIGATQCVASCINGGGKTQAILTEVAERQASGDRVLYQRLPLRESTTPSSLVDNLSAARCWTILSHRFFFSFSFFEPLQKTHWKN